jgi:hypothetical protein
MKSKTILALAGTIGLAAAAGAQVTQSLTALSNGTIRNTGPTTSPWFHNAQAPGSEFESYGISSFQFTAANFGYSSVTGITSAQISYMQSNAGFTADGGLEFYVSFDSNVGAGNYGGLIHNSTGAGLDDGQFTDAPSMQSLGTGTFTETATGDVDTYMLSFAGALETALVDAINNGDGFSIIIGVPSGSTAATYAGIESNRYVANGGLEPDSKMTNLTITAVPEPSVFAALAGLACLGLVALRRRR